MNAARASDSLHERAREAAASAAKFLDEAGTQKRPTVVLADASDPDSLIRQYLETPGDSLRRRILEAGGAQASNALTRLQLSRAGLCPPQHAPKIPAKFLDRFGPKLSAWTRFAIVRELVREPAANHSTELEVPGQAWPAIEGAWGLGNALLDRFGASDALADAKRWLDGKRPPLEAPFDAEMSGLVRQALRSAGLAQESEIAQPTGFSSGNPFPSVDATAANLSPSSSGWLASMQSSSGGWAQFDKDQSVEAIRALPIANVPHAADVACPGVTGRAMLALTRSGTDRAARPIQNGVKFLIDSQLHDGSWRSVWGGGLVNGTSFALRGLAAAGESDREAHVLRGGEWLRSIQNADGGWGEDSPSTPTHTAWAILGLLAGGDSTSSSLGHGVRHLCESQRGAAWTDPAPAIGGPGFRFRGEQVYATSHAILALMEYCNCVENAQ